MAAFKKPYTPVVATTSLHAFSGSLHTIPVHALLVVFFFSSRTAALAALDRLALDTAWSATAERRVQTEVNVLLGVHANHEGRNIDELLSDTNVALLDKNARMMDRLGESKFHDLRLKAALQEVLYLQ